MDNKWTPAEDEKFWIVNDFCQADWKINYRGSAGCKRYIKIGNCFRTKSQAEKMAGKFRALLED